MNIPFDPIWAAVLASAVVSAVVSHLFTLFADWRRRKFEEKEAEKNRKHDRERWDREREQWESERRLEHDRWRSEMYRENKFKALAGLYQDILDASLSLTQRGTIQDPALLPEFLDAKIATVHKSVMRAAIYLPRHTHGLAVEAQRRLLLAGEQLLIARQDGRWLTDEELDAANMPASELAMEIGKLLNPEVL